jgi:hypothetical protein
MNIPSKISPQVLAKYSIHRVNRAFSGTPKDNWKDRIQVVLGDDKDPSTFQPQFKLMRWDNEVNCSIRLEDFDNYTLSTEAEKIKLVTPTKEVNLYDLPIDENNPEGGFEFKVVLLEPPKTNEIKFTLKTKGLDFYYQPELTKEIGQNEIVTATETQGFDKDGNVVVERPENVVGSYAVYASENKINYINGKEYKVGKVGHIYRPKITDATGKWAWEELNIKNGILTITIPQDFLNKAVYPISSKGVNFGYTDFGDSKITNDNRYRTITANPGQSGTATSISFGSNSDVAETAKAALYTQDGASLLAPQTEELSSVVAYTTGWNTANFTNGPAISNQNYEITVMLQTFDITGDSTGAHGTSKYATKTYGSWDNSISLTTTTFTYSIYATFTPPLISGSTVWGHITGVTETNIRTFATNWAGTGNIENSGDAERIALQSGQYMESEVVITGLVTIQLLQNTYRAGDTVTLKYRHGADVTACLAASYSTYSAPFMSLGYVQIRLEATI